MGLQAIKSKHSLIGVSGKVALIQVAYKSFVYVFDFFRSISLPPALAMFMNSDKVIKVGRHVGADLQKIARDYNIEYGGSLELGTFCRERGLIENASLSLADICANTLKLRLLKEPQ